MPIDHKPATGFKRFTELINTLINQLIQGLKLANTLRTDAQNLNHNRHLYLDITLSPLTETEYQNKM